MTRAFDEAARAALDVSSVYESNEWRPRQLDVRPVPVKFARPYIATYHYSATMPDSTRFAFGGFYGDKTAGIVVFGMGASLAAYKRLIPDIERGEYVELTRAWVADAAPPNTASRLVASAVRLLPPEIRLVLSFADQEQGHVGYMYQALNFIYCGEAKGGGSKLFDAEGKELHPRLLGIYKMRHPADYGDMTYAQIAKELGWSTVHGARSTKHRYALGRDFATRRALRQTALPYPKAAA